MKTQKKKGLQKYQDSGYTKAPYNDPFASIFSNALGSGLYAYTNNNPFLNTHDSILGQPLSTAVGNQGTFLGSLPMFQQLNKPLGSWDQESKNFQKQVSSEKTWEQFARENEANYKGDPQGLRAAYVDYVNSESGKRYDSTVAAQKQWNEFGKPLAANMFALDELNTLSEKSYNQGLKLDAQDLTKGTKGQEFRGFFAKDGMRVGSRSINELHRIMGADTGLPMQGKENGGQINQLQQILGYKDNSPFKNLPFQTINSNSITMDEVNQPLLAIADNGDVKLMPPNSGLHKFKGAKSVVEIPIVKNGSQITSPINLSKNINPFRLSPINSFGLGGFIREGVPSRPKSEVGFSRQPISGATTKGPMGPKATDIPSYNGGVRKLMDLPENEYIPTENLIPVQAEKGEIIVLPTGDISKVMATKRHHQMDEDEVTDVAPEGAYILSSFGKVRINKDEAEQIITETGVKPYRVGGSQDSPTEKNLASMMIKKSMAPADVAKRVDRFFPVNSTSNPFEFAANNENKIHRVPYLEGLIQLSELDKLRKGIDSGMESQQENEDEMTREFKNGGSTWGGVPMREMFLPKAQTGLELLLIPAISGLLQSGIGALGANAQKKDAARAYADVLGIVNKSAADQKKNKVEGTMFGNIATAMQNPVVQAVYNDPTFLRQERTQTPLSTLETIANRAYANMPNFMQNAPTWQAGLGVQQAAYAAAIKGANDARLSIGEVDRNAQNGWLRLMQTNLDLNNTNRVGAANATTLNRNQQLGNIGDRTQGMFDSFAGIEANRANAASAARLGQAASNQQAIRAFTQAGQSTIGTAGAAAYDYFNRPNTTPVNQTPQQNVLNNLNGLSNPPSGSLNLYGNTAYSSGYNPLLSNGQFSTGCVFLGGQWINRQTGGPC